MTTSAFRHWRSLTPPAILQGQRPRRTSGLSADQGRASHTDRTAMLPRTVKTWVRVVALVAFISAVLVSWHHEGDGVTPVLLELLFIAGMIGVLWVAFLASKTLERRRTRR
jgi:hypothetical protein